METTECIESLINENGIELDEYGIMLNVDSISFISLLVNLEQEFNIEFPDDYLDIESLNNIGEIEKVITQLMQH